ERDTASGADHAERLKELTDRKVAAEAKLKILETQLEKERKLAAKARDLRKALEQPEGNGAAPEGLKAELTQVRTELTGVQGESPLVYPVVDGAAVAEL